MIIAVEVPTRGEVLDLYASVGWTAYTADPDALDRALANSHLVLTARDAAGTLVGLARTVSDGEVICYVQDVLVDPAHQRGGVGRALLERVLTEHAQCRQVVLMTDAEGPDGFYRSLGFRVMAVHGLVGYAR